MDGTRAKLDGISHERAIGEAGFSANKAPLDKLLDTVPLATGRKAHGKISSCAARIYGRIQPSFHIGRTRVAQSTWKNVPEFTGFGMLNK